MLRVHRMMNTALVHVCCACVHQNVTKHHMVCAATAGLLLHVPVQAQADCQHVQCSDIFQVLRILLRLQRSDEHCTSACLSCLCAPERHKASHGMLSNSRLLLHVPVQAKWAADCQYVQCADLFQVHFKRVL